MPTGVTTMAMVLIGGGGGGGLGEEESAGGGGGGAGQFTLCADVPVTAGETISLTVGDGGAGGTAAAIAAAGGTTTIEAGAGPTVLCGALGGNPGTLTGGASGGAVASGVTPLDGGAESASAGGGGGGVGGAGAPADGINGGGGGMGLEFGSGGGGGGGSITGFPGLGSDGGGDGSTVGACATSAANGLATTGGGGGGGRGSGVWDGGSGGSGIIVLQFAAAVPCVDGGLGYNFDISAPPDSSVSCIVPDGATTVDILAVGGGGGGGYAGDITFAYAGGGGGGGDVVVCADVPVTAGGTLSLTVGAGGSGTALNGPEQIYPATAGGVTQVKDGATDLCSALGGVAGSGETGDTGAGGASGNNNVGGAAFDVTNPTGGAGGGGGGGAALAAADATSGCGTAGGAGQQVSALASPGLFSDLNSFFGGGGGGGSSSECNGGLGGVGGGGAGMTAATWGDQVGTAPGGGGGGGSPVGCAPGGSPCGNGGGGFGGYIELRFPAGGGGGGATISTSIVTQVSDVSILEAGTISDTATITAAAPCPSAPTPASPTLNDPAPCVGDPTGTVQWYYCYDSTTAPTSCDETSGTAIDTPINVVDETPGDSIVTAELVDWSPVDGAGYYLFHAVYSGDDNFIGSADDGTDEAFEVVAPEHLHVCVDKLYVVYGASAYTPKVYYCVPDEVCPPITSPGSAPISVDPKPDDCDEDDSPISDGSDGYSTVSGGKVVESGMVSALPDPWITNFETVFDPPIGPMHFEHGIPDGWHKVHPSDYPDTTPPTCSSEYVQGDGVSMSPMPITCEGGDAGPYVFDYEFVTEMYIHPAMLTVRPKDQHVRYGDDEPSPYTYTIKGFKLGETATVLDVLPTCDSDYTSSADAGMKFDITCSGGVADNYTLKYRLAHVHVDRRKVDLRAPDRVVKYGDPAPAYGMSVFGLVGPDAAVAPSQLKGFSAPVCGAAYTAGTPAGTYPINCVGGDSANYEFVMSAGTLTVQKAALKVTPGTATVTYGGSAPVATATVTGFLNGQNPATAAGYRAPRCTAAAYTPASNVGSPLPITCTGGSATNYTFEQVGSSNLTVTKAAAVVKAAAKTVTYGSAPGAYGYTVTGLLNGQTGGTLGGLVAPICASSYTALTAVGVTPAVTCAGASSTNYTFSYVAAQVTVGKATLTVTPNSLSVTRGSAAPAYTYTVTGFPNGVGPVGSYTAPKCASGYSTKTAVGSYSISCSGGSAANYAFVYRTASLAVR